MTRTASIVADSPGISPETLSDGEPSVRSQPVTDLEIEAYGAKRGTTSESKSWPWRPDPWDAVHLRDGTLVLSLQQLRFTVVRYEIASFPFRACYATFRGLWTTHAWKSVEAGYPDVAGEVRFPFEILETGGGTLKAVRYSGYVYCPAQSYAVSNQWDIDPEIYDIITGARVPPATVGYFRRC